MKNKIGKKQLLIAMAVFLSVIFIGLCAYGVRSLVGWRPYKDIQSEDLYYACYTDGRDSQIYLFNDAKLEEFSEILRNIRIYSVGKNIQYGEGYSMERFLFELEENVGCMICLKQNVYFKIGGDGDYTNLDNDRIRKYGILIDGKQYRISQNMYDQIENFISSLSQ